MTKYEEIRNLISGFNDIEFAPDVIIQLNLPEVSFQTAREILAENVRQKHKIEVLRDSLSLAADDLEIKTNQISELISENLSLKERIANIELQLGLPSP